MHFFRLFAFVLIVILASCRSRNIVINNYLQKVDTGDINYLNLAEPRIQKNDLLSIKVYSQSADPRTDIPYNLPEQAVAGATTTGATAGFLVADDGTIDYPRLGTLQVEGMTRTGLAKTIKERLDTVLKNPSVIVRFMNYRVTVLGEVRTPGAFTVPTERITILEALGLAGDITDFGKRDTVKVARENNGKMQIGYVSLISNDLFSSPYYRLQQNDVVFVEQNRRKIQQQERQDIGQQIGLATGIITAIVLILNVIR